MKWIDNIFFIFFLKKGNIKDIKNKFLYLIFFKLFRLFLKGPFVISINNFKLNVFPQKTEPTCSILKRLKFHEFSELNLIENFISKNRKISFIDAGANYGYYSLFVASQSPKNKVFSFEPSAVSRQQIIKNKDLNFLNNIKIEKFAISNSNSVIDFYESQYSWESSAIINYVNKPQKIQVPTITLDHYFENKKFDLNNLFVKLDVEGLEINALYGAKNLINKFKPVIQLEFSKMLVENKLFKIDQLNNFLDQQNYLIYDFQNNKQNLSNLCQQVTTLKSKFKTIGNFILLYKKINF